MSVSETRYCGFFSSPFPLQLGKENGEPEARKFRGKANPRSSVNRVVVVIMVREGRKKRVREGFICVKSRFETSYVKLRKLG